jgi:hypothetical protein
MNYQDILRHRVRDFLPANIPAGSSEAAMNVEMQLMTIRPQQQLRNMIRELIRTNGFS